MASVSRIMPLNLRKKNNVAYFYSIDRGIRALSALYKYHCIIKTRKYHPPSVSVIPDKPLWKILAGKSAGNLAQDDAFRILEAYGFL